MINKFKKYEDDLDKLVKKGDLLLISIFSECGQLDEQTQKDIETAKIKVPSFREDYDAWYSVAMQLVRQVLPDRLDDFVKQYKDDKRKDITFLTYTISDYMLGTSFTRGFEAGVDGHEAIPRFKQQVRILHAAKDRLASNLFDMTEVLQAELFDDEVDAARELVKKGFLRGAGAISGVVLEKHLANVCDKHAVKLRKRNPTINDFNEALKQHDVIDIPTWRFIQHLGDLRNLCDHNKDREPKREELDDLLDGVSKIMKTVF